MIATRKSASKETCELCEPLTCTDHGLRLDKNLEKLRLDLQMAQAACRNAEDAVRSYRRMHDKGKPSERRESLGEFDHTETKDVTTGKPTGERACMIGYKTYRLAFTGDKIEVIHGNGPRDKCKVYRIHA